MITFIIVFTFYLIGCILTFGLHYGAAYEDSKFLSYKKPLTLYQILRYNPDPRGTDSRNFVIFYIIVSLLSWLGLVVTALVFYIGDEVPDIKFSKQDLIDQYDINNNLIHEEV